MTECSVMHLPVHGMRPAEAIRGGFPLRFRFIDARPISEDLLMIRVSRLALLALSSGNGSFPAGSDRSVSGATAVGLREAA